MNIKQTYSNPVPENKLKLHNQNQNVTDILKGCEFKKKLITHIKQMINGKIDQTQPAFLVQITDINPELIVKKKNSFYQITFTDSIYHYTAVIAEDTFRDSLRKVSRTLKPINASGIYIFMKKYQMCASLKGKTHETQFQFLIQDIDVYDIINKDLVNNDFDKKINFVNWQNCQYIDTDISSALLEFKKTIVKEKMLQNNKNNNDIPVLEKQPSVDNKNQQQIGQNFDQFHQKLSKFDYFQGEMPLEAGQDIYPYLKLIYDASVTQREIIDVDKKIAYNIKMEEEKEPFILVQEDEQQQQEQKEYQLLDDIPEENELEEFSLKNIEKLQKKLQNSKMVELITKQQTDQARSEQKNSQKLPLGSTQNRKPTLIPIQNTTNIDFQIIDSENDNNNQILQKSENKLEISKTEYLIIDADENPQKQIFQKKLQEQQTEKLSQQMDIIEIESDKSSIQILEKNEQNVQKEEQKLTKNQKKRRNKKRNRQKFQESIGIQQQQNEVQKIRKNSQNESILIVDGQEKPKSYQKQQSQSQQYEQDQFYIKKSSLKEKQQIYKEQLFQQDQQQFQIQQQQEYQQQQQNQQQEQIQYNPYKPKEKQQEKITQKQSQTKIHEQSQKPMVFGQSSNIRNGNMQSTGMKLTLMLKSKMQKDLEKNKEKN